MELRGLKILNSCLYDQRKVDPSREPLSVDMKFSGEKTSHKLIPVHSEGGRELSETETGLGQHLAHVRDEKIHIGGRIGLARHGHHLG